MCLDSKNCLNVPHMSADYAERAGYQVEKKKTPTQHVVDGADYLKARRERSARRTARLKVNHEGGGRERRNGTRRFASADKRKRGSGERLSRTSDKRTEEEKKKNLAEMANMCFKIFPPAAPLPRRRLTAKPPSLSKREHLRLEAGTGRREGRKCPAGLAVGLRAKKTAIAAAAKPTGEA